MTILAISKSLIFNFKEIITYLLAALHLYIVRIFEVVSNGTIPLELRKLKLTSGIKNI